MAEPLVSVLITSFNQEKFIAETLTSALEQDYDNLEVIIADDASTDATADIIMKLTQEYPTRLIPTLSKENLGITKNCNRALQLCRGKYIALLGGDDVMLPGKIRRQVQSMEQDDNIALSYHDLDVFDSTTHKTLYHYSDRHPQRKGTVDQLVRYGCFCGCISVMVRASCIPSYGFDERIKVASDYLLFMDVLLANKANKIDYIDGVYARYRRHGGNITNKSHIYGFEESISILDIIAEKAPWLQKSIRAAKWERTLTYAVKNFLYGEYRRSAKLFAQAVSNFSGLGLIYAVKNANYYLAGKWSVSENAKK